MPIKQEFWATPKSSKILLFLGLFFITVFPFYGLIRLGTSTTAIAFISLLSLIPGIYFISCSRKIKTSPILIVTNSEITIQAPLNKAKTVPLSEIKSIEADTNQGLILKSTRRFNSSRIPAKMLSLDDRERLITLLNASIKRA